MAVKTALRTLWLVGKDFTAQILGTRRAAGLLFLCLLPAALLTLFRILESGSAPPADRLQWWNLLWIDAASLLLQAVGLWVAFSLSPSTAQEDPEEGSLSYLLARPVPKGWVFLGRWLACGTFCAMGLAIGQILIAAAAHVTGWEDLIKSPERLRGLLYLTSAQVLASYLYTALGGLLALLTTRPFVWGMAYFFLSEMILAGTRGILAQWTLIFHLRSLAARGLPDIHEILQREMLFPTETLAQASSTQTAFLVLAGATLTAAALGAWQFARREWAPPAHER